MKTSAIEGDMAPKATLNFEEFKKKKNCSLCRMREGVDGKE